MGEVGVAVGVRRVLIGLALALLAGTALACGGERPVLDAGSGELRVVAWAARAGEFDVALEGKDLFGQWNRTAPLNGLAEGGPDGEGWRRTSELLVRGAPVTLVQVGRERFEILLMEGPIDDHCRRIRAVAAPRGRPADTVDLYHWRPPWCGSRSPRVDLDAGVERPVVRTRIAGRRDGDCIDLRIELRPSEAEWRAWDAGRLCSFPIAGRGAATGPVVGLQHWTEANTFGVVVGGPEITGIVSGRIVQESCGGLELFGGLRTLYLRIVEGPDCDQERFKGVLWWDETDDGVAHYDRQANLVYDWEFELASTRLPEKWRATFPLERSERGTDVG